MKPSLRVYVAGASNEAEHARISQAMNRVVVHPRMTLTYDWLAELRRLMGKASKGAKQVDESLSEIERWRYSRHDYDAVRTCDVLWLLAPPKPVTTEGAWIGMGLAIAMVKDIVISPPIPRNIFGCRGTECTSDEEAFAALCLMAGYDKR